MVTIVDSEEVRSTSVDALLERAGVVRVGVDKADLYTEMVGVIGTRSICSASINK
jgi:hypothetical protein